jgi:hypothetical protein
VTRRWLGFEEVRLIIDADAGTFTTHAVHPAHRL